MDYRDSDAYANSKPSQRDLEALKKAQWEATQGGMLQGAPMGPVGECATSYRPPTLREQSEKATIHHREQLDKHAKAAMFFASHPEFDEFIQLIRAGVVQI